VQIYPPFPFAYFEMAMVHVARQSLDIARRILEEGVALQKQLGDARSRFPANGLHWMLGSVLLARGDVGAALTEFERERMPGHTLYSHEYAVTALNGQGCALLESGDIIAAEAAFRQSLEAHREQVRPHLGLAVVARQRRQTAAESDALAAAGHAIHQLRRGKRTIEAILMSAAEHATRGKHEPAVTALESLLLQIEPKVAGWIIPIEPFFRPLAESPRFSKVLERLAERAA
jgi:tetratricopeptide (TPR) repeat protein